MDDDQAQADHSDNDAGDDLQGAAHDLPTEASPLKSYENQVDNLNLGEMEMPDDDGRDPKIILDEDDDTPSNQGHQEEEEEQDSPPSRSEEENPPDPEEEQQEEEEEDTPTPPPVQTPPAEEAVVPGKALRITPKDDVEAVAMLLKRRNPELSLSECLTRAQAVAGESPSAGQEQEQKAPVRDSAAVNAEISELLDKKHAHMDALEYDEANAIERQVDHLRIEAVQLTVTESSNQITEAKAKEQRERETFETKFTASGFKATEVYPDCMKADSALTKRMEALDAEWEASGEPLFNSPDKPFLLAKQAAYELGIPMARKTAAPETKAPAVPEKKAAKTRTPFQPAGGHASTSQPTSRTASVDAEIAGIESESDYENYLESRGIR